ncbi:MAG: hypothetical protein FWG57_06720 [Endomicrobia bacterium]|nr:hypothetical protein [Endomicrobiia bacterium]
MKKIIFAASCCLILFIGCVTVNQNNSGTNAAEPFFEDWSSKIIPTPVSPTEPKNSYVIDSKTLPKDIEYTVITLAGAAIIDRSINLDSALIQIDDHSGTQKSEFGTFLQGNVPEYIYKQFLQNRTFQINTPKDGYCLARMNDISVVGIDGYGKNIWGHLYGLYKAKIKEPPQKELDKYNKELNEYHNLLDKREKQIARFTLEEQQYLQAYLEYCKKVKKQDNCAISGVTYHKKTQQLLYKDNLWNNRDVKYKIGSRKLPYNYNQNLFGSNSEPIYAYPINLDNYYKSIILTRKGIQM